MGSNTHVEYYRKRAKEYEMVYQKPERQGDLKKLKRILKKEFTNQNVLEMACGTGYWTAVIAPQTRSVLGIDINDSVLEIARQKKYGKAKVDFKQMAYQDLRKTENSFDAIFGGFIWSHIPKQERATFLSLCFGQLKRGGALIFIDNQYVEGNSTPISRMDEFGNTFQIRQLQSGEEFEVIKNFPNQQTLLQEIGERGKNLEWTTLDYYWLAKFNKV